jgi:hypothetical protein
MTTLIFIQMHHCGAKFAEKKQLIDFFGASYGHEWKIKAKQLHQLTIKRDFCASPIWPTMAASLKPWRLKTAITSETVSGEQLTNKPPLVCGSDKRVWHSAGKVLSRLISGP